MFSFCLTIPLPATQKYDFMSGYWGCREGEQTGDAMQRVAERLWIQERWEFPRNTLVNANLILQRINHTALENVKNVLGSKNGAAYVTRTRDPIITNDVLYQLS